MEGCIPEIEETIPANTAVIYEVRNFPGMYYLVSSEHPFIVFNENGRQPSNVEEKHAVLCGDFNVLFPIRMAEYKVTFKCGPFSINIKNKPNGVYLS